MDMRRSGLTRQDEADEEHGVLDRQVVKKAIEKGLQNAGVKTSKNLVLRLEINNKIYYAKRLEIFDSELQNSNPELAMQQKIEDGVTQVLCHRLLHKILGKQQPLSYLYYDVEVDVWLITPEVSYISNLAKLFSNELERNLSFDDLKNQILNLPKIWSHPDLVDEKFIDGIFKDKRDLFLTYFQLIKNSVIAAVQDKNRDLLDETIEMIDKISNQQKVSLKSRSIDISMFVKLLCVSLLLAESDCSLNNIVLIDKTSKRGMYIPVMFDIDLILGKLNNIVQRIQSQRQCFDLKPSDFEKESLLQPQGHRPKLWLDAIVNYNNKISIFSLDSLTAGEIKNLTTEVFEVMQREISQFYPETLKSYFLLSEDFYDRYPDFIKDHIVRCKIYIFERTTTVFSNSEYQQSKHPTATYTFEMETKHSVAANQRGTNLQENEFQKAKPSSGEEEAMQTKPNVTEFEKNIQNVATTLKKKFSFRFQKHELPEKQQDSQSRQAQQVPGKNKS